MAVEVLTTADGRDKTALGRHMPRPGSPRARQARPCRSARATPPLRPARPDRPELLAAARRAAPPPGLARRAASPFCMRVAHIELNAVDLHWDIIARFTACADADGLLRRLGEGRGRGSQAFQPDLRLSGSDGQPLRRPARPCRHVARGRGYGGRPARPPCRRADGAGGARAGRDAGHDRGLPQGRRDTGAVPRWR